MIDRKPPRSSRGESTARSGSGGAHRPPSAANGQSGRQGKDSGEGARKRAPSAGGQALTPRRGGPGGADNRATGFPGRRDDRSGRSGGVKPDERAGRNSNGNRGGRVREAVDAAHVAGLWRGCFSDKAQESLSQLTALAKDSRIRDLLAAQSDRAKLRGLLEDENPKVRKNAARLIGVLAQPSDEAALIDALEREQTQFVVPSLLLALGNCGADDARSVIRSYLERLPEPDAEAAKHIREAKEAASVALSRLSPREERSFLGLPEEFMAELTALEGCGGLLESEAKQRGLLPTKIEGDSLFFPANAYPSLFSLRCFTEALIPIGQCPLPPLDAKKADVEAWALEAARSSQPFVGLLRKGLSGEPPYPYRIELRGVLHAERGPLARAVALALDESGVVRNSPSGYDAELRLTVVGRSTRIAARLTTPPDGRFAYRRDALPASIHPVAAATLLRFALPYLKPAARVLDPCCGSGTLLVERAKLLGAKELVGVDISADAVRIARGNVKASGESVEILGGDMLTFRPRAPFDELIANLPFGTRVGTHDVNAALYKGLMERLPELLTKDGVAVLYTTQRAPLLRLAHANGYNVIAELRLEAGGLNPWAILLKRH